MYELEHKKYNFIPETKLQMPYDILATTAEEYLGWKSGPYDGHEIDKYSERGIDCTEFICIVHQESGLLSLFSEDDNSKFQNLRYAREFYDSFGINVDHGLHRRGDLIFYSYKGVKPDHVGIVVTPDTYIHAPGKENTSVCIVEIKQTPIISQEPNRIFKENPKYKRPSVRVNSFNYPLDVFNSF